MQVIEWFAHASGFLFVCWFLCLPSFWAFTKPPGEGVLCSAFLFSVNNDNLSFSESMSRDIPK